MLFKGFDVKKRVNISSLLQFTGDHIYDNGDQIHWYEKAT